MPSLSKIPPPRKVAIVCDWLTGIGGAERVVLELHHAFPDAPIFTSQYDPAKIDWFKNADVRTGWLQKLPASLKKFLPVLRAWYFSRLDLRKYDLVISSSGAEAKGVKTGPGTIHISYCHSPTHYYWTRYDQYMKEPGFGVFNFVARLGLKLLVGPMKRWDYAAAQRPDYLIANSNYTKSNIARYYKREAVVVHPPVETSRFEPAYRASAAKTRHGFVVAGRQTPYKRIDLAVEACSRLNVPLTVIGTGPDHERLVRLAGPSVTFLTDVSDKDIAGHFAAAQAFIFPNADDFGIVAVEAMAAGTPLVALKDGGATDYITEGRTGVFFAEQTVEAVTDALQTALHTTWNNQAVFAAAQQYSVAAFTRAITTYVQSIIKEHHS